MAEKIRYVSALQVWGINRKVLQAQGGGSAHMARMVDGVGACALRASRDLCVLVFAMGSDCNS